jgi:Type II secretion system (T2SS), protein E, N-terminal domain/HEAT repeats
MSSRLSSLLVRDAVVGVKRMERAFQHQVIDGGSLDTILLEQGLVTEAKLTEYLALAAGLPAAGPTDCDVLDDEAVRRCPHALAEEHEVAPLTFEGGALTVLVRDPVDLGKVAALADRLGFAVLPRVVPEYRWHLVFARDFDQVPDPRYLRIAVDAGMPVGTEGVRRRALQGPAAASTESFARPTMAMPAAGPLDLLAADAAPVFTGQGAAPDAIPTAQLAAVPPESIPTAQFAAVAPESIPTAQFAAAMPDATPTAELPVAAPSDAPTELPVSTPAEAPVEQQAAPVEAAPVVVAPALDASVPTVELPAAAPAELPVALDASVPTVELPVAAPPAPAVEPVPSPSEAITAQRGAVEPTIADAPAPPAVDAAPSTDGAPAMDAADNESMPALIVSRPPTLDPVVPGELEPGAGASTQQVPTWRGDQVPTVAARNARAADRRMTRLGVAVVTAPSAAAETPAPSAATTSPATRATPGASDGVPDRALPEAVARPSATLAAITALGDDHPIDPATARGLIEAADDRDRVFMALLRALRTRTRWAGLLTVQGSVATGRIALSEPAVDVSGFARVAIPLDRPSPFHAVVAGRHPYVGQVNTGDPGIDEQVARMGGKVPRAALLLPIVLRDRCVALAVAHRGSGDLTMATVADLLPLALVAAEALSRIVMSRKQRDSGAPPSADPAVAARARAASVPTIVPPVWLGGTVGGGVVTRPTSSNEALTATAQVIVAPPLRPLTALLADLDSDDAATSEAALAEGVLRADELLPVLPGRFPGKLKVDRYALGGRVLRAAQYGSMLEMLVRIGPRAAEMLIELLDDPDRDTRFYATVCLGAIRPRAALQPLVERVFDSDYGVRSTAIDVLATFSPRDLDRALVRARQALHSEELDRVAAATHAPAMLADTGALADLIELVGRDARRGELARRALVALTRHDFGTTARKWRSWADEHGRKHRIEWLIDALGLRDLTQRDAALEELRRLTGEDFGGVADESRKDRDQLRDRWTAWWTESGRARFANA